MDRIAEIRLRIGFPELPTRPRRKGGMPAGFKFCNVCFFPKEKSEFVDTGDRWADWCSACRARKES